MVAKINTDDQHDVGSPFPDFTFGVRLGGEWNNFDFNLFFDGMVGNKIYNYPRYRLESGNFNGNMSTVLANYVETGQSKYRYSTLL